jgi:hypothetical protein
MLRNLRDQLDLTRQDVSRETGRSVNFILKAEQLTFPVAPPALTAYYAKHLEMDPDIIREAYRDAQRDQREKFHHHIIPRPSDTQHFSFCRKWLSVYQDPESPADLISPNQYQVSKLLCVPASAVYYAEKNHTYSAAIYDALSDLLAYCRNGNFYADYYDYSQAQEVHNGIERIWREINGPARLSA